MELKLDLPLPDPPNARPPFGLVMSAVSHASYKLTVARGDTSANNTQTNPPAYDSWRADGVMVLSEDGLARSMANALRAATSPRAAPRALCQAHSTVVYLSSRMGSKADSQSVLGGCIPKERLSPGDRFRMARVSNALFQGASARAHTLPCMLCGPAQEISSALSHCARGLNRPACSLRSVRIIGTDLSLIHI